MKMYSTFYHITILVQTFPTISNSFLVVRYSSKSSIGMPKCLESRTQSVASLLRFGFCFTSILRLWSAFFVRSICPSTYSFYVATGSKYPTNPTLPKLFKSKEPPKGLCICFYEALFVPKHFPINNSYSICTSQAPQERSCT